MNCEDWNIDNTIAPATPVKETSHMLSSFFYCNYFLCYMLKETAISNRAYSPTIYLLIGFYVFTMVLSVKVSLITSIRKQKILLVCEGYGRAEKWRMVVETIHY